MLRAADATTLHVQERASAADATTLHVQERASAADATTLHVLPPNVTRMHPDCPSCHDLKATAARGSTPGTRPSVSDAASCTTFPSQNVARLGRACLPRRLPLRRAPCKLAR